MTGKIGGHFFFKVRAVSKLKPQWKSDEIWRNVLGSVCVMPVDRTYQFWARREHVNMPKTIESPAKCEVRAVIRFLFVEECNADETHQLTSNVYGETFMSVRKGRQEFLSRTYRPDVQSSCTIAALSNSLKHCKYYLFADDMQVYFITDLDT